MLMAYLALATLARPQSAPDACLAEVTKVWPHLVETLHGPGITRRFNDDLTMSRGKPAATQVAAIEAMERLETLCVGDPAILANVRALNVEQRLAIEDFEGAFRVMQRSPLDPASPRLASDARNLLLAAAGVDDPARFAPAREAVRRAHDGELVRSGWLKADALETPLAAVDSYRAPNGGAWLFMGWPKRGGMPLALFMHTVRYMGSDKDETDARLSGCATSSPLDALAIGPDTPPEAVFAVARRAFSDRVALRRANSLWASEEPSDPSDDEPVVSETSCTAIDEVLPAFTEAPRFTGAEYAGASDALTEMQVRLMLDGSLAQQATATDYILAHPDTVEPFELMKPISTLLRRGDTLQAAFWFYFWQIRSAPWARFGPPDAAPALRGALNATMGPGINEWIGSDPAVMIAVTRRAISFEAHEPLYPGRPDGVSAAEWARAIAETRADYAKGVESAFRPERASGMTAERSKAGLYNGPLKAPGAPLRDAWR